MRQLLAILCLVGLYASARAEAAASIEETTIESASEETPARKKWREVLSEAIHPTLGCFKAEFPSTEWLEVECVKPPEVELTVGNGVDYSALNANGSLITKTTGYFYTNGVSTETDNMFGYSAFSVQINSNRFSTSASNCNNIPGCLAWEQFIYLNQSNTTNGLAFIQTWLINYGGTCPSSNGPWYHDAAYTSCYRNSPAAQTPSHTIHILENVNFHMQGYVRNNYPGPGYYNAVMVTQDNVAYSATQNDAIVNLRQHWNTSEFNVFGAHSGSRADFSPGTTLQPVMGVVGPPSVQCYQYGTTNETNNLNLAYGSCGPLPPSDGVGITFQEGN